MIVEIANTFELHAEKGPAKGNKIPFAVRVCSNPICNCQRLTFILEQQLAIPGAGIESAPRSEFSFDFATADTFTETESSAAVTKRIDDFLEGASEADFDELQRVFTKKKQTVVYNAPLSEVPEDWSENLDASFLIGFHEIFPLADHLRFEYDGIQYWVEDCYCIRAGCDCRETLLSFAPAPKNTKEFKLISECAARYDFVDSSFRSEKPKDSGKVQALMAQLSAQYPGVNNLLKKRYARVRQLVAERPGTKSPSANPNSKPVVAASRIGRNDPCPCGSGKKYKKCCGA